MSAGAVATNYNPDIPVFAALGVLFVAVLIGVIVWVSLDSPRSGPFDATFHLVDDRG